SAGSSAAGPTIPGIGSVSSLPGVASDRETSDKVRKAPETLSSRISEGKRGLRTWFEHFFLTGNPSRSLNRICLALLVVFLLKNIFDYLQSVLTVWVEQAVVRDLRNEVYAHLHELSLSFFHSRRTGALLSRLTNDIALVRGALA